MGGGGDFMVYLYYRSKINIQYFSISIVVFGIILTTGTHPLVS